MNFDAKKYMRMTEEARRRVARAAAMDASATPRSEADAEVIWAGTRACIWLGAGGRAADTNRLIKSLVAEAGQEGVLAAAVALCRAEPPGPSRWLSFEIAFRYGVRPSQCPAPQRAQLTRLREQFAQAAAEKAAIEKAFDLAPAKRSSAIQPPNSDSLPQP